MRDSRKVKGVIEYLTTDIEDLVLYRGLAPEKLDHHVRHLPCIEQETQLNAMCEGMDDVVSLNHLMYQVSISLNLLVIEPRAFIL